MENNDDLNFVETMKYDKDPTMMPHLNFLTMTKRRILGGSMQF